MKARPATVSQLLPPAEIAPSVTLPSLEPRLRSKSKAGFPPCFCVLERPLEPDLQRRGQPRDAVGVDVDGERQAPAADRLLAAEGVLQQLVGVAAGVAPATGAERDGEHAEQEQEN